MLPEMSTASIRSLPVVGIVMGSPVHWGRARAAISETHINQSSKILRFMYFHSATSSFEPPIKGPKDGTRRAGLSCLASLRKRRTSQGNGRSKNANGQIHSIISDSRFRLVFFVDFDSRDQGNNKLMKFR